MMNDVFVERMVKRKLGGVDAAIILGVILAALALMFLSFVIGFFVLAFPMLTVFVTAGAIFGAYQLIGMRMVEFEYSLTNGYLSVDKILNRSRRKRLTSFECSSCEDIGHYREQEPRLKNQTFDTRVFATESSDTESSWYMIVRSQKTGKTLLVFDPDEELLEAVKKFIPRQLKFEKFGR